MRRILALKFILRLFEKPYGDAAKAKKVRNCKKHRDFARKVAQESIVLLKNEKHTLPIGKNVKSIAVIGPNADEVQLGDYSGKKFNLITPFEAIKKRAPKGVSVGYAKGCGLWGLDRRGFGEAVSLAEKSDIAILVMGESKDICNEGKDTHDIRLPGVQQELAAEIAALGKPVVLVLVNGRHLALEQVVEKTDAIIETWFAGEEQGEAIADILWGDVNPGGKLPVSLPRTVGHLPSFYNHVPSARANNMPGTCEEPGRDYIFSPRTPLFGFGFGLSYTTFRYSSLKVTPGKIGPAGEVNVSVKVKNTGKREGPRLFSFT